MVTSNNSGVPRVYITDINDEIGSINIPGVTADDNTLIMVKTYNDIINPILG